MKIPIPDEVQYLSITDGTGVGDPELEFIKQNSIAVLLDLRN
jgi:hypothetical protein